MIQLRSWHSLFYTFSSSHPMGFIRALSKKSIHDIPDRSCLEVVGSDALKFLQGICTTDTLALDGSCCGTVFLTPKGRVLADAFLYERKPKENDIDANIKSSVIIEVHSSIADSLKTMMSVYKLRSKLKIYDLGRKRVIFVDNNNNGKSNELQLEGNNAQILCSGWDPRICGWGMRFVVSDYDEDQSKDEVRGNYTSMRIEKGLAEGPELSGMIPLEGNLDIMQFINFHKGCYVGQELTARTKFSGVVRKRIIPFKADMSIPCEEIDLVGKELYRITKKDNIKAKYEDKVVGKVVASDGYQNTLIHVKLAALENKEKYKYFLHINNNGEDGDEENVIYLHPHRPEWWPEYDSVTGNAILQF